ncbi:MAG: 23S rRNA (adenine(2503)-C(2))-methyltransferase RlmN [Planctomycetota bacterium]|nr:MAG: 23S rRNA (adenine(2503)-C(2))-methyltransferase RlmN [Planctomycetota bacterium]
MSSAEPAKSLLALEPEELAERVVQLGGRPFHARVIRREVLARGTLDYGSMTSLPVGLREALTAEVPILAGVEADRTVARDRTVKLLIEFTREAGQDALVETVHIPPRKPDSKKGATLCVSTQVGCPVACPFCASGLAGLTRNLAAHEIVEQYVRGRAIGPLARSVVMGIGEPLLNWESVKRALDVVHDEMQLGARKMTVSTVGFPDRVRRAARDRPRFQLAISLHTPDDDQRDELVPSMAGTPIEDILAAGDDWFRETGREVTYEVVLLGGVNDSAGHAQRLAARLRSRRATVNLIPFNPSPDIPYHRPTPAAVETYRSTLEEHGVVATVRWSRGLDGTAACGQLRIRAR